LLGRERDLDAADTEPGGAGVARRFAQYLKNLELNFVPMENLPRARRRSLSPLQPGHTYYFQIVSKTMPIMTAPGETRFFIARQ
jgi:hypothetical protein